MMREALALHDRIIEGAVSANDGVVFKTGGDSFCASFASPHRAVTAAVTAQKHLREADWATETPIAVRMGLHTGMAQVRDNDYFGPTLNRTARLMAAGHGGQVLLSSTIQHLLVDDLPTGVSLLGLGTHYLKDLDRPEVVFQLIIDGLPAEFPPLSTVADEGDPLERVSQAYKAKKWRDVVEGLERIESQGELSAEQHEMLAFSLWWLGDHQAVIRRFEKTYNAYLAEDNPQGAAVAALEIAEIHFHNLSHDIANGWVRRAERLLEDDHDSSAKGYLLRWQAVRAFESDNDLDLALSLSEKVGDIAKANMDGNLEVLAAQDRGRFLVASGNLDEGMPLMDEAMIAAVAGDVNPMIVGRSYCNMLAVCDQTGDVRRAAEWSQAAERWCEDAESSAYPGVCRIFKAEVMWQNGDWVGAESEVMRASSELGMYTDISGEAWYQFGMMRLRAGDYQGAESAFQESLTRGREPVPGYAQILAHRGDVPSAIDLLERSLSDPRLSKLDRARFLPTLIELTVDHGNLDRAAAATTELEEIGALARSGYYLAQASQGRGVIDLKKAETAKAIEHLRGAVQAFTRLGLPYESARARTDLAAAYRADGAEAMATMTLNSAKSEFERLGSGPDVEKVTTMLEAATS